MDPDLLDLPRQNEPKTFDFEIFQYGRDYGHASQRAKPELRVGLYARVSTHVQQTTLFKIRVLREYPAKRSSKVAVPKKEIGSGASQRELWAKLREAPRSKYCWSGG
jgi:hypothetical protein